eukprot:5376744-Alexandrium_andersonii.AAC.1
MRAGVGAEALPGLVHRAVQRRYVAMGKKEPSEIRIAWCSLPDALCPWRRQCRVQRCLLPVHIAQTGHAQPQILQRSA